VALVKGYSGFPYGYREIVLTTLGLHRGPDPERFIRLDSGIGLDKDVVPLTSLVLGA
jgi:hypothetical protein